jgi:hypothetical protein
MVERGMSRQLLRVAASLVQVQVPRDALVELKAPWWPHGQAAEASRRLEAVWSKEEALAA